MQVSKRRMSIVLYNTIAQHCTAIVQGSALLDSSQYCLPIKTLSLSLPANLD